MVDAKLAEGFAEVGAVWPPEGVMGVKKVTKWRWESDTRLELEAHASVIRSGIKIASSGL